MCLDVLKDQDRKELVHFIKKNREDSTLEQIKANPFVNSKRLSNLPLEEALNRIEENLNLEEGLLTVELWNTLLDGQIELESRMIEFQESKNATIIPFESTYNNTKTSLVPTSYWQQYRRGLEQKGFAELVLNIMEKESLHALRNLSNQTVDDAIKGMVVGYVQSGKTANMAALMSQAADNGFNFFIILTGTIENLRKQTENRLINDFNLPDLDGQWVNIDRLQKGRTANSLVSLNFQNRVYFNVCLKHAGRLKDINLWMDECPSKLKDLKILVIDDEADQASINTKAKQQTSNIDDYDQTAINKQITNLVNNCNVNGESRKHNYGAMNYIMYTATPYANFLNESFPETLYPKSFIQSLTPSNEYIGAKQIFGDHLIQDLESLNIVRTIPEQDVIDIKNIDTPNNFEIPSTLKKAVSWFILATSARRVFKLSSPSSFLFHESVKVENHEIMAQILADYLKNNQAEIIEIAETLWNDETIEFTLDDFKKSMPNYSFDKENDYPAFENLKPYMYDLLETIAPIQYDAENQEKIYHNGIHIVIDNSRNNAIIDGNSNRLEYPKKKLDFYSPAFLIIGGNTLSRGLTIEGLVCSYFVRTTNLGDSLMQMGRWFGFRKNYELLPRIWMDHNSIEKFQVLTNIEESLRQELVLYSQGSINPAKIGPHIKDSSNYNWLRITARNKMKNAKQVKGNFARNNTQLIIYDNDETIINNNIQIANDFTTFLVDNYNTKISKQSDTQIESSIYWNQVDFDEIYDNLLNKLHFNSRAIFFNHLEDLRNWMLLVKEKYNLYNWNVVVAGIAPNQVDDSKNWNIGDHKIGKVTRNRVTGASSDTEINIKVLRAPRDLYADIDFASFTQEQKARLVEAKVIKNVNEKINNISIDNLAKLRTIANLDKTPQLIIYRIDKDSTTERKSKERANLDAKGDLIGISIYIPGMDDFGEDKLTVNMVPDLLEEVE